MSALGHPVLPGDDASAAGRLGDLRAIQGLVCELSGLPVPPVSTNDIDRAYERASQLARARFDAMAAETAAFAAAGLSAIIAGRAFNENPTGGAAHLADEMARAIRKLEALLT